MVEDGLQNLTKITAMKVIYGLEPLFYLGLTGTVLFLVLFIALVIRDFKSATNE
jgi:hypothetical protein